MRVVHVAPTAFGRSGLLGGGERYPLQLARTLAGDIDCELVTFGAAAADYRAPSGLRVRVLPYAFRMRGHPAHPVAPGIAGAVDADLVHTHQLRATPSRLATLAATARRTPVVTTDHGLGGGGWFGLLPALIDRFLTVSCFSAQTLRVPVEKVRVIYGGADPARFHPDPAERRGGVLFVGRLTPHKGVDRLLAALPSGATATIAGSAGHDRLPPERDYPVLLQKLAAGKDVRFTGAVADADLPGLYRRAEVFVLPSVERTCYGRPVAISELLGLAVLEAMASATPVVVSRLGGLREIVHDGETGFLVTPGDVAELRDRVGRLLGDRLLARRMGKRARESVLASFTWTACARRCLRAYDELVAAR